MKQNAQHTPAPWAVSTEQDPGSLDCSFNVFPEGRNHLANICRVQTNGIGGFDSTRAGDVAIAEANARLIAAAPDLKAEVHACRKLLRELKENHSDAWHYSEVRSVENRIIAAGNAILKAEGVI